MLQHSNNTSNMTHLILKALHQYHPHLRRAKYLHPQANEIQTLTRQSNWQHPPPSLVHSECRLSASPVWSDRSRSPNTKESGKRSERKMQSKNNEQRTICERFLTFSFQWVLKCTLLTSTSWQKVAFGPYWSWHWWCVV